MNVALAYNVKKNEPSPELAKQEDLEFDSLDVINGIKSALQELGHSVYPVEADENAFITLKELKGKIDIVFNIAEGLWGEARESQIPIFCEVLKIPYTHSGPTTHAISLDKYYTKQILKGADGVTAPDSYVVSSSDYIIPDNLKFPLLIKPNNEGSSKGVLDKNVVRTEKDLTERIKLISENFKKEVLVEEYIEGREFTVAVLGNNNPRVLPIVEQKFDFLPRNMNRIASYELKWIYEDALEDLSDAYECPAKLSPRLNKLITDTTLEIYKVLDVRDCARIDYRLNDKEELYFIEVNTLPGINPDEKVISYFPLASRIAGMTYKDLINEILVNACKRYGI